MIADWSYMSASDPNSAHPQEPRALHLSSLWLTEILDSTAEVPSNSVPYTHAISCTQKPSYNGTMHRWFWCCLASPRTGGDCTLQGLFSSEDREEVSVRAPSFHLRLGVHLAA